MSKTTEPEPQGKKKLRIAIAGATGFIGKALCIALSDQAEVIALSRRASLAREGWPDMEWRQCDLYSLRSCKQALEGVDRAVYLVHSMMPAARLTQASFEDLDLILADNFARAAAENQVQHVVYVGGLDPETPDTSAHLSSRMEVERALAYWVPQVTALRAGLVIGQGGSSFDILYKLVRRLPVLACPQWTSSQMQPVALEDLVTLLVYTLQEPRPPLGCHDVGVHEAMTYRLLIERSARLLGLRRWLIPVPLFTPGLSALWVALITGTSQSLIAPLIESLRHDMLAKNTSLQNKVIPNPIGFEEAFGKAIGSQQHSAKVRRQRFVFRRKTNKASSSVRSVQRMVLPAGKDALWVAQEYLSWLPIGCKPLIRVEIVEQRSRMFLRGTSLLLLELTFCPQRSTPKQAIYDITDGVLLRKGEKQQGIFEFRVVLDGSVVLAAIHHFYPRLPWYVYKFSQAQVHALVMYRFSQHLKAFR